MGNKVYENQKKTLNYSKSAIDKAADAIRHGCTGDERTLAIKAIQNYREVHLYPLMLMKNHLVRTANRVNKKTIVARRLKRLPTIIDKLERPTLDGGATENRIKFTRMQDIGGCRAIVKNLKQLMDLRQKLENSKSVHKIIRVNDYLNPKPSGYGGVHLIYSCFEDSPTDNPWRKLKIEIQLRTELQHHWATSLEIIDIVEGLNLKTTSGNHEKWRSFFSHAGKLVAYKEGAIVLTDQEYVDLLCNLLENEASLNSLSIIARSAVSIRSATHETSLARFPKSSTGMFLLDYMFTDNQKLKLFVRHYNSRFIDKALQDYAQSESDDKINLSVLLSAEDARNLKKAYPNYFGSANEFINFIRKEANVFYEKLTFGEDFIEVLGQRTNLEKKVILSMRNHIESIIQKP